MANLIDFIPFIATALTALGLVEIRLAKKVDKDTFEERCKVIDRIEVRMMRLESHLLDRALTKKEAEILAIKNNEGGDLK